MRVAVWTDPETVCRRGVTIQGLAPEPTFHWLSQRGPVHVSVTLNLQEHCGTLTRSLGYEDSRSPARPFLGVQSHESHLGRPSIQEAARPVSEARARCQTGYGNLKEEWVDRSGKPDKTREGVGAGQVWRIWDKARACSVDSIMCAATCHGPVLCTTSVGG